MNLWISIFFIAGYTLIALEHPLKLNKSAIALLLAAGCWVLYGISAGGEFALAELQGHLSGIAGIIFFLLGAMAIVELISVHNGFSVVSDLIRTANKRKLLWVTGFITFFLSAALDNLTTAIVMVSLVRKLIRERNERMVFAGIIVIAANAGGAWSPIGDVTTTMLWMGGQVTGVNIVRRLFLPSMVSLILPLAWQSLFIRKENTPVPAADPEKKEPHSRLVFFTGLALLLSVPIFKTITHLPPYLGILSALGIMWVITETIHHRHENRQHLRITHALTKIDHPGVLFFLGILLAVAALDSSGILHSMADGLNRLTGNKDIIASMLGLLSAVVDNVPLTAAAMAMYPLSTFPPDSKLWELLAYTLGTGGSCLIIGSAAGVVVMGMEKINFFWYLRKITLTALIGYFGGLAAYLLLFYLFG